MSKDNVGTAARRVYAQESKIVPENTREIETFDADRTVAKRKQISNKVATRMPATSRIPVSRAVWEELSGLKKPGETYDHLLDEMIEREKKHRLFEDMDRIEKRGKFVAMKW
jgi:hypothetical protein